MKIDIDEKKVDSNIVSLKYGETFLYKNGQKRGGYDVYMIVEATDCHGKPLFVNEKYPISCVNLFTGKITLFNATCCVIPIKLKVTKDQEAT